MTQPFDTVGYLSQGVKQQITPGYNTRLGIFFKTTAKGQKKAYRWSMRDQRSFPMPVKEAELFIAQGLADQITDPR